MSMQYLDDLYAKWKRETAELDTRISCSWVPTIKPSNENETKLMTAHHLCIAASKVHLSTLAPSKYYALLDMNDMEYANTLIMKAACHLLQKALILYREVYTWVKEVEQTNGQCPPKN